MFQFLNLVSFASSKEGRSLLASNELGLSLYEFFKNLQFLLSLCLCQQSLFLLLYFLLSLDFLQSFSLHNPSLGLQNSSRNFLLLQSFFLRQQHFLFFLSSLRLQSGLFSKSLPLSGSQLLKSGFLCQPLLLNLSELVLDL